MTDKRKNNDLLDWELVASADDEDEYLIVSQRLQSAAGVGFGIENAMLMSAAPDLLDALEDVIEFLDQMNVGDKTLAITPQKFGEWTTKALAAINKAKGG